MPAPATAIEYTPVRARRGKLVHAVAFTRSPEETACGLACNGYLVVPEQLTCADCKAAVFQRVRTKR